MKNIILIAPPAAGKGTVSKMICDKYNIPHISAGDLLRDEISKETKIGIQIKDIIARGELVTSDIITKLLKKRLAQKDTKKGYILDGYPRNIEQAKGYDQLLQETSENIVKVIFLDISKDEAIRRITSRIVCSKCGSSYNLSTPELSPVREGICDRCGSDLNVRTDDNEETFLKRFDTYLKETAPLIDYYEKNNNLIKIDVNGKSTEEVFSEVKKVIE